MTRVDGSGSVVAPPTLTQLQKALSDSLRPVHAGENWYLVDKQWWTKWSDFVNRGPPTPHSGGDAPFSEKIDNSFLVEPGTSHVKPQLHEMEDYVFVPEDVWLQFMGWYGGGPVVKRTAISTGRSNSIIEIHPPVYTFVTPGGLEYKITASRTRTVRELVTLMLGQAGMPWQPSYVLWASASKDEAAEKVADWEQTLEEANLTTGQVLRLSSNAIAPPAAQSTGGSRSAGTSSSASSSSSSSSSCNDTGSSMVVEVGDTSAATDSNSTQPDWSAATATNTASPGCSTTYGSNSYSYSYNYSKPAVKPGWRGLVNLGNTCFMNSALQCLSCTDELRKFFLEKRYVQDLNKTNPLGNGGDLALAFAELLEALWSTNSYESAVSPKFFKSTLARFAPQFSGWQQQDSQELMAFLLDGLHEDLNRVLVKEIVELKESDGRPDAVVASEAWNLHLKRNQSIIVDLFQGQLKSKLECPECGKISITFDPFMYLSLPLRLETEPMKVVEVIVMPFENPTQTGIRYRVKLPESAPFSDLKQRVAELARMDPKLIVFTDVWSQKIYSWFVSKSVESFGSRDVTVVYEIPNLGVLEAEPKEEPSRVGEAGYSGSPAMPASPLSRNVRVGISIKSPPSAPKDGTYTSWNSSSENFYPLAFVLERSMTNAQLYHLVLSKVQPLVDKALQLQISTPAPASSAAPDSMDVDGAAAGSSAIAADPTPEAGGMPFVLKLMVSYNDSTLVPFNTEGVLSSATPKTVYYKDHEPLVEFELLWQPALHSAMEKVTFTITDHESVAQIPREEGRYHASLPPMDLSDCLELFTRREMLGENDTWYCPSCKEHRRAYKEFKLWKMPKLLIVHLKRFQFTGRFGLGTKLDNLVRFSVEGLDLSQWLSEGAPQRAPGEAVYNLYAVSKHSGSLCGGHYTAHGKVEGTWVNFNDSWTSQCGEGEEIVSSDAYLLFFKRRE